MAYRLGTKKYIQDGPGKGYVNIPFFRKFNCKFNFLCGGRQIGKTWGVLHHLLETGEPFLYMRRTKGDLDFAVHDEDSPFNKHKPEFSITAKPDKGAKSYSLFLDPENDTSSIGRGISLQGVAGMRGFDGTRYKELVYDEFIPEQHVRKIRFEGDAMLNAYVTINSTREIGGADPLKVWFLSNSDSIISPIFEAYNISHEVERTFSNGGDFWISRERGILVALFDDSPISEKLEQTALFKAIGTESRFSRMALKNDFSYDDFSLIGHRNLREYKPVVQIGSMVVMESRNHANFYVIEATENRQMAAVYYTMSSNDVKAFSIDYGWLYHHYIDGDMVFSSMVIKKKFLEYFER